MRQLSRALFAAIVLAVPTGPVGAATGDAWSAQCAKCHGDDGRAQTPVGRKLGIESLVGSSWADQTPEQICDALRSNKGHAAMLEKLGPEALAAACGRVKEIAEGG